MNKEGITEMMKGSFNITNINIPKGTKLLRATATNVNDSIILFNQC